MPARKTNTEKTTLDSDVAKPSVTVPGDGPADTTDASERATSVPFAPGEESLKVGTVNTVVPLPEADSAPKRDARWEEYGAVRPDGSRVTVRRNIETGDSEVK